MFIWAILACSTLLIQASDEQTLYEQNIQNCLRDLFAQYNKSQQENPEKTIAKLAAEFKKKIDQNSEYKNIKSTDLLVATNKHINIQNHVKKYQKFLEATCFLYARNLYIRKNITVPNDVPKELHTTVAGAILTLLLMKETTASQAEIGMKEDFFEPGTKTSETGITYITLTNQIYATIEHNKIVPKKAWPLDSKLNYSFGGVSADDLFMYHIKTDTNAVSKKTVFELYKLKSGTVDTTELPANSTAIDIAYNTQNKTFAIVLFYEKTRTIQICFYDTRTKQTDTSKQMSLPRELSTTMLPAEDPTMRGNIMHGDSRLDLTFLRNFFTWTSIDHYIAGICYNHRAIQLIVYDNNIKTFSFIPQINNFIKNSPNYTVLLNIFTYTQANSLTYAQLAPKTFIIDYESIIQEKLRKNARLGQILTISFDFTYMRYIEKNRTQKKIIVYDILPHKLCAVINFMNMTYHRLGDKYTNILDDALYAIHALNNTSTYQSLQPGDSRISKISKELLEILPLPQSKVSAIYASIKRNLGSLWHTMKRNYLPIGVIATIGGLMLFSYWQEQKLLYPSKPAPDISTRWPGYAKIPKVSGKP